MIYQNQNDQAEFDGTHRKAYSKPELSHFARALSYPEVKLFISASESLREGHDERAIRLFRKAVKHDKEFYDGWFMWGFLALVKNQVEVAKQAFLHILQSKKSFEGIYIVKFLPDLSIKVNLFENFPVRVMPTTPEVAAILARIYLIEGKPREAKKIIHPAYLRYPKNSAIRIVWAQSMIDDDNPGEVIDEIDKSLNYHRGDNELDLLVTWHVGKAYLHVGDFRSGIFHLESVLHFAKDKNPRLIDRFRTLTAQEYESKGYLLDTLEILNEVGDKSADYGRGITIGGKIRSLTETINKQREQGIFRNLKFQDYERIQVREKARRFLELKKCSEPDSV